MTKTETVYTVHGELEYDKVDCTHCETTLMADNAVGVEVDVACTHRIFTPRQNSRVRRNLCPYCAASLLGYDRDSRYGALKTGLAAWWYRLTQIEDMGFGMLVGFFGAFIGVITVLGLLGLIGVIA